MHLFVTASEVNINIDSFLFVLGILLTKSQSRTFTVYWIFCVTFLEVEVSRRPLRDVSRPRDTDPLSGLQRGEADGGDVGGGDLAANQSWLLWSRDHLSSNHSSPGPDAGPGDTPPRTCPHSR